VSALGAVRLTARLRTAFASLVVLALLSPAAVCWRTGTRETSPHVLPGAPMPRLGVAPLSARGLVWVLQPADCIACQSPSRRLRTLQRALRSELDLVAVVVGGDAVADSTFVASCLRQERLAAPVHHLSTAAYQNAFGDAPIPALYLVRDGRVVDIWTDTRDTALGTGSPFDSRVRAISLHHP
jgi:hypothetical protein